MIKKSDGVESRVGQVINVLRDLGVVSFDPDDTKDLDLILSLTAQDITDIKRWLEDNNPGAAKLIYELRRSLPKSLKFDIRMVMIGILYFATKQRLSNGPPPRKLKSLS